MKKAKKAISLGVVLGISAMLCIMQIGATTITSSPETNEKIHYKESAVSKPIPTLSNQGNVLISSGNPDGDDLHPTITINSAGTIVVTYEEEISMFDVSNPIYYSEDGGQSWTMQFDIVSEDTGLLVKPDIKYCPMSDEFFFIATDPIAETYNEHMYRIPGDIASAEEISGIHVSGTGASGYAESAITYVDKWMVGLFIADMSETGPRGLELIYYDEDWAGPPNGGFYYDGQSVTTTAPAYNPEMATGATRMFMVFQTDEGENSKITYKATVTDLELLWTSAGGPGGMDKYSDIEVWPWQGYVVDASEKPTVQVADPDIAASGNNVAIVYMTTDNVYGDWDIQCAYTSEHPEEGAEYTWETSTAAENHPIDDVNPAVYMSGNNVYCVYISEGNLYLVQSEDGGATWGEPEQINEEDGTVVAEDGTVDIDAGGIVWTDNRDGQKDIYYASLPAAIINVEIISGGFGVSATITNTGIIDAENVEWTITVDALLGGGEKTGTIETLSAGGEEPISSGFMLGLGPADITVTANGATKTASGFMLGPFVLGVS